MSEDTNNGGPAFPVTVPAVESYNGHAEFDGMTLRDYFAAKAMQGMVSRFEANEGLLAAVAYKVADAMLKAGE